MKVEDVAKEYGFEINKFKTFAKKEVGSKYHSGMTVFSSDTVDDDCVATLVSKFNELLSEEYAQQVAEKEHAENKRKALAEMLISSGFNFDGYKIVKYSGYISGDDVVQVSRGEDGWFSNATNVGESLSKALRQIRRQALQELKEAAYDLGCNAVIGVDFDYITLEPETANSMGGTTYLPYVFCVTANGNAVIVEKE